jgi:hypothetical protein
MVTIRDGGPSASESDIARFEELLGSALPEEYRSFLLHSNGGRPEPDTIDVPGLVESPTDVQVLFGLGRDDRTSRLDWNLSTLADRVQPGHLPIALDSGGNVFVLSLGRDHHGAVLYYDLQSVFGDMVAVPEVSLVAPSFASFLRALRPFD